MTRDADILTLAQWFSPSYPVGAFSYSHGLEWAIEADDVSDGPSLREWVGDVLDHGAGRSDAIFVSAAYAAGNDAELAAIDDTCRAFAASKERLLETTQQGRAFCQTTAAVWEAGIADLSYPVAVGRAAHQQQLPLVLTASMYLHAFASNLISVGMRLIPQGQTEGQTLIRDLAPLCRAIAADAAHGDLDALSSTAFLADIAAMQHETQYSRTFRT